MEYAVSLAILIAEIVIFFALGRGQYRQLRMLQLILSILVALPLLASAIVLHFLQTNLATSMIPPVFPATEFLIHFTGVLEILGAIGLFVPLTRRFSALGIALLMVVIFPANVYVAGLTIGPLTMPSVPVRLAMQVVFIWLALVAGYGFPKLTDRSSKA